MKTIYFYEIITPYSAFAKLSLATNKLWIWKTWVDKRIETSESRCAFGLPIFTNESLLGDPAMMKHQGWHQRFNKIFYFYTKITKISATEICHLSTYLEPHLTGWKCQPALQTHFFLSKSETSGAFIMAILEEFKNRYLRAEWTFQSAPTRKWGGALPFSCHKTEYGDSKVSFGHVRVC